MIGTAAPATVARKAKRTLRALARPAGDFDASRYFRGSGDLGFYNVGTTAVRALARSVVAEHKVVWSIDEAMMLADLLIADRYLEVKALARRGASLDLVYQIARRLHDDGEDLIQKAVGWALREAGKTDMPRLERYLRAGGPRTTLRDAIERFAEPKRPALLAATRAELRTENREPRTENREPRT